MNARRDLCRQTVSVGVSASAGAGLGAAAVVTAAAVGAVGGIRFDDFLTGAVIATFWIAGMVARATLPASRAAALLMLSGVVGEWFIAADVVSSAHPSPWWGLSARVLQCLTFATWLALLAVYPHDRADRPARVTVAVVFALAVLLPTWWFLDARGVSVPAPWAYQVLFAAPVIGLILLLRTYQGCGPEQRRQLRWLLLGMASAAAFYAFSATPLNSLLPAVLDAALFATVTSFVAITAAIGLVRPRVVDVDLAIRRVPVFATLWLLIAAMYATATAVLGVGAGQHLPVEWAVVLTLTAALLFQPARQRLERIADRLVFGRRLDGYDVLRDLSASLEASSHLDEVGQVITTAIQSGVDASWVRLVAAQTATHLDVYGIAGTPDDRIPLRVSVVHADTEVGVIECGPRSSGTYTEADREVVRTIARQAALAVLNVQRAAELSASRRRLVDAADNERTRIERDLHDGVQQHLVALVAAVETARTADNPEIADAALTRARDIGHGAIGELRSVIAGILPPVLADGGLLSAVQARAGQLPMPVRVEVLDGAAARFSREIEIAGYFFVSELLVNVVRHAQATAVCVKIGSCERRLQVTVRDNGRGIDADATWRGLQGLRDRFAALDGTVRVERLAEGGTVVRGELPL